MNEPTSFHSWRFRQHISRFAMLFSVATATLLMGCGDSNRPDVSQSNDQEANNPAQKLDPLQAKIFNANKSEDLVLRVTPKLGAVAKHLQQTSTNSTSFVADEVSYLGPADNEVERFLQSNFDEQWTPFRSIPIADNPVKVDDFFATLWFPITQKTAISKGKFGILWGEFKDNDSLFETKTKFEGQFQIAGQLFGIQSKQTLVWKSVPDQEWQISEWRQESFRIVKAKKPLFQDVTNQVISNEKTLEELTSSEHEKRLLAQARNGLAHTNLPEVFQYFTDWTSLFQYPSASVVDINNDGWDDVFVLDRHNPSVLLKNNQDGTFTDVAEEHGLRFDGLNANCSVFADFDNDGDPDLLIGRTMAPSLYFRNEGQKFVPDEETNDELQLARFISSISVVDFNRDGLLDVYLSTYATRSGEDSQWIQYAVPPAQQAMLLKKMSGSHPFIDRQGPPNILLVNKNGKLRRVDPGEQLSQWRNSFQAVWTDYDSDGDPDIYVCNDFAPDVILRNDTLPGSYNPIFLNVTPLAFPGNSMGFGMGASLGDYNSDGELDLYISNMYSKAGQRIIKNFDGNVDPRISISAKGNFLYQKQGSEYKQMAGTADDQLHVSKVGWSFGGQFADFNNDSHLDLYVPSGFFTAPESIAAQVDL